MWWMAVALGADIVVTPNDDLVAALETSSPGDRIVLEPGTHRLERSVLLTHEITITSGSPTQATVSFQGGMITSVAPLTIELIVLEAPVVECIGDLSVVSVDVRDVLGRSAFTSYGTANLVDVRTSNLDSLLYAADVGSGRPAVTASLVQADGGSLPLFDVHDTTIEITDAVLTDRTGLLAIDGGSAVLDRINQIGFGTNLPMVDANNATVDATDLLGSDEYVPWVEAHGSTITATGVALDRFFSPAAFELVDSDLVLSDSEGESPENLVRMTGGTLTVTDVDLTWGYGFAGLFDLDGVDATFTGLVASGVYGTVVEVDGGTLTLDDAEITDGTDSAIVARGADLIVRESLFARNRPNPYGYYYYYGSYLRGGGAIHASDGTVELSDLTLLDNEGELGGAVLLSNTTGTVSRVWACGNQADAGGALWADAAVDVMASAFRNNAAVLSGGALSLGTGTASHVTLLDNEATVGSAMYGAGTLTDSLIVDHVGIAGAGGLDASGNLWWDNSQPLVDPLGATELLADPFLVTQTGCNAFLAIPTLGTAGIDAGAGTDPDGSPADLGHVGGPDAAAALWEDADGDGIVAAYDCDDDDGAVLGTALRYLDVDGDGFGAGTPYAGGCPAPGDALAADDCDDSDPDRAPGLDEILDDGIDQDCDGLDRVTCFTDDDGDGFGVSPVEVDGACAGLARVDGDCDDGDATVFPGAEDPRCDGINADCGPQPLGGEDDDGDGLTWEEEQALGTSDCDQDSDGDGVSDGAEVDAGSDPAEPLPGGGGTVEYRTKTVPNPSEPSYGGCGCTQPGAPAGVAGALALLPLLLRRR